MQGKYENIKYTQTYKYVDSGFISLLSNILFY